MTGHQTTLARTSKMKQTNSKSKRNDRSHTMIIEKLGGRLSILIAALYSLIPGLQSLVTSLQSLITLFQVFLSQNVGVPNQNSRRSKSIPRPFQMLFQVCSKLPSFFGQDFSKSLRKLHQNYTKITPNCSICFYYPQCGPDLPAIPGT